MTPGAPAELGSPITLPEAKRMREQVCVMGLGYIGLPTASLLATKGYRVLGVDVNAHAVDSINHGNVHIVEPGLDILVKSAVGSGNLSASMEPAPADVFILAVPTPVRHEDHEPELSYIDEATEAIAPHVAPGNLVILESTSPVRTTEQVARLLSERRPDLKIPQRTRGTGHTDAEPDQVFIAHCPERVLPGQILRELVDNDRVVGGVDDASAQRAAEFYRTFVGGQVLVTDSRTAEMCKLVENAFRDVNIAYANELSIICEQLDINVWELIEFANRHPRVNVLRPGPGVGGHCIAVDPWFIVSSAPEHARLIRTAREVNDSKPCFVVESVRQSAERYKEPVIACLGLSFKADIDDLRESPAVEIVRHVATEGLGTTLVVEPHIRSLPPALADIDVELVDLPTALKRADVVVLLVDHREFLSVERETLLRKVVIDTRGIWR